MLRATSEMAFTVWGSSSKGCGYASRTRPRLIFVLHFFICYYSVAAFQQVSFYPQCPEAKRYSCRISVRTEPLQTIHCSQLKWCYNFLFLSPNSLPSSKDATAPTSQTKKCLLRTTLLKFPGQDLSTNLPATLAQINTNDWTRRLINIVNQYPHPPLPRLCFQGSSAHQIGRTAESSNTLSCCRRICQRLWSATYTQTFPVVLLEVHLVCYWFVST